MLDTLEQLEPSNRLLVLGTSITLASMYETSYSTTLNVYYFRLDNTYLMGHYSLYKARKYLSTL